MGMCNYRRCEKRQEKRLLAQLGVWDNVWVGYNEVIAFEQYGDKVPSAGRRGKGEEQRSHLLDSSINFVGFVFYKTVDQ